MRLSARAAAVPMSATIALDARAKELIASGRDVVNMSAGEPDFEAPAVVRQAAARAIESKDVRYTAPAGRIGLRQEIGRQLKQRYGVDYAPTEITVCHSAKHALSGTILALVEPGDQVLLPAPAWGSYDAMIRFAGGEPIWIAPRPDMGPDLEAIAAACGPRTRGMLLNSPNNPSGYVFSEAEARALADLCQSRDLWILSDEIYGRLVYGDTPHICFPALSADARSRTVLVDGASKTFAMTGYRIGFLAGPEPLARAVASMHSQLTGSPNAISQDAWLAGLREDPPEVETARLEFERRRAHVVPALRAMGLEVSDPHGAFYAFPSVAPFLGGRTTQDFCAALLEAEGLALVPGSIFGVPEHVRLSYGAAPERIEAGLERLARFLKSTW